MTDNNVIGYESCDNDDDDLPGHLDADGLDPGDDLARGDARPHLEPLVRPVRHHEPAQPSHLYRGFRC